MGIAPKEQTCYNTEVLEKLLARATIVITEEMEIVELGDGAVFLADFDYLWEKGEAWPSEQEFALNRSAA